ncbi:Flp family type IVb pilin [Desulfurivibrio alkaliphilus]|uniref:Flp/Fap pilin component n=1 Tax=Desulfurivibrio alkaliphilus (strain DSM 19089 / UNIQEM U267 / AHT2) TaxID=589865 RepID=D6Z1Q6_DESAT|nr:Flp family type IVb pilin [Desulfurivibrio alkaliphilus]ADH85481.1 Flp/Fap pilin component [Desulfurivibrio alkaliphilus AHT 2]
MQTILYTILQQLKRSSKNQEGATAIEYAMIVAVMTGVVIAGYQLLGEQILALLQSVAEQITGPGEGG